MNLLPSILPGDLVGSCTLPGTRKQVWVPLFYNHPRARLELEAYRGSFDLPALLYKDKLVPGEVGLVLGLQGGYALLLVQTGWGWADGQNIVLLSE